jgi:hypothetical protein
MRQAARVERAARCTIKIPTLSWIPCGDGGFVSDPLGYAVTPGQGSYADALHNGELIASSSNIEHVKELAERA